MEFLPDTLRNCRTFDPDTIPTLSLSAMKKTLLTCTLLGCLFMAAQAQIVITEIMYNPPESGTDSLEYVELYNRTNAAVDVSGWNFTQGFVFAFPAGSSIPAGGYAIVCKSTSFFNARFTISATVYQFDGALTNTPGEDIELRDANGAVMDYVDYMNAAPWPAGTNGQGSSLVLCDVNADNSLPASWAAATTPTNVIINGVQVLANPGAASNCGVIPVVTYPVRTIAQMTNENADGVADSLNKVCELTGTVYGVNLRGSTTGVQFTIADAAGTGIMVFNGAKNFGYTVTEKDQVTVRGRVVQFNGLTQINVDTVFKKSANNPLVAASSATKLGEDTESRLIKISNLTLVDASKWTTGLGTGGFSVRAVSPAHPNDTIDIRIDNDVDLYNLPVPPQPFDLIGLGGQFDNTSPFTSGYQVLPRYRSDISTLVGTREADFSDLVQISPNPASEVLRIQTAVRFDRIRFYSGEGRLVHNIENPAQNEQVRLDGFAGGIYLVQFEQNGAFWTTKVVKQ